MILRERMCIYIINTSMPLELFANTILFELLKPNLTKLTDTVYLKTHNYIV